MSPPSRPAETSVAAVSSSPAASRPASRAAEAGRSPPVNDLAAMGDDYELLFAAPASARADVAAAAAAARTPVSRIGALCPGAGLLLDGAAPARLGYQHR